MLGGNSVSGHKVHRIRRDPQGTAGHLQIVLKLGRGGGDPVLTYLTDVGGSHIVDDPGGIDHHNHHQEEDDQDWRERSDPACKRSFRGPPGGFYDILHLRIGKSTLLRPGIFFSYLFLQLSHLLLIGPLLPVHLVRHMYKKHGNDRADQQGDERGDHVAADQGIRIPREFVYAGGDAHVPPGIGHPGDHDAAGHAVIVRQINRIAGIRANLGDYVSVGSVRHVHHRTRHIVKGIRRVGMNDHAQVLVHQKGVTVRRDVCLMNDVYKHIHEDVRRQHALQPVVTVDRL